MFRYKYQLRVVNAQKGIISLRPTASTYVKAMSPALVCFAAVMLFGAYLEHQDAKLETELDEETPTS